MNRTIREIHLDERIEMAIKDLSNKANAIPVELNKKNNKTQARYLINVARFYHS